MSLRNKGRLAAAVIATMICIACGQIYRPVVIPINNTPPSPGDFHAVFSLNTNALYGLDTNPANPPVPPLVPTLVYGPGSGMQIDVGGDTDIGIASLVDGTVSGANPTHGISLPNFSRVFVANAGGAIANAADAISSFVPATQSTTQSGIGAVSVVSYPNFIPNPAPQAPPYFCPYLPDFVAASQNSTVYVANYGVENAPSVCNPNGAPPTSTDSISVVNAANNVVSQIVYLPAGSHPVAMAQVQTPNGNKLYVANQGSSTVSSFNTVDMSLNEANVAGFTGTAPVWIVARGDGQLVYVLSQVDGQVWTINATNDTVISNVSVGAGANYELYDPNLNRLYVTNPTTSTVYIFSVAGNAPSLLNKIVVQMPSGVTCPNCSNLFPMSVAALADGTRAYFASYQLVPTAAPGCTDPVPGVLTSAPTCFVQAWITVMDALSTTVTTTISAFPSGTPPVPEVANCLAGDSSGLYNPGLVLVPNATPGPVYRFATRFRVSAVAATDSSRVYVSVCDAGSVAIVNTTDSNLNNPGDNIPADTLLLDLQTPFGLGTTGNALPQQNPIFMLTGR